MQCQCPYIMPETGEISVMRRCSKDEAEQEEGGEESSHECTSDQRHLEVIDDGWEKGGGRSGGNCSAALDSVTLGK